MTDTPAPGRFADTEVDGPDPADVLAEPGYDPASDVEHQPGPDADPDDSDAYVDDMATEDPSVLDEADSTNGGQGA